MGSDTLMWIWLIAGIAFCVSELIVPGMITVFLGIAAFIVAAGYQLGFLENVLSGFTTFFVTSLFSVFTLRELAKKLLGGETRYKKVNEDVDAYGRVVDVIEDVKSIHEEGRIKFRGTTWAATTGVEIIPAGQKAKIVSRDGLVWIVEPYQEDLLEQVSPSET